MTGSWTGADLKAWRKRMGWTQQQAADALGIRLRAFSERELDRVKIRTETVLACTILALGSPMSQRDQVLTALEGQHRAIDGLLARLIEVDETFRPTKWNGWAAVVRGADAIKSLQEVP